MKVCNLCRRCFDDSIVACDQHGREHLKFNRPGGREIDNKYRLDEWLGAGGMGAVYKGTHVHLKKVWAIKLLKPEYAATDNQALRRLRREALTTADLQHPNLVHVHDYGEPKNQEAYIVMELLNGQTLRAYAHGRQLDFADAIDIVHQTAHGLAALHDNSVLHRDLKPENIMLTQNQQGQRVIKVVDFGLAKNSKTSASSAGNLITPEEALIGTLPYVSPEACRGLDVSFPSDIYSLGIIIYELLAGRRPFDGADALIIQAHIFRPPPPLRSFRSDVPAALEALVADSLKKEPEERLQSAADFAHRLSSIANLLGLPLRDKARPPQPPKTYDGQPPPPAPPPDEPDERKPPHQAHDDMHQPFLDETPMPPRRSNTTRPIFRKKRRYNFELPAPLLTKRVLARVALAVLILPLLLFGSCRLYSAYETRQFNKHLNQGMAYLERGANDEAIKEFDQATAYNAEQSDIFYYRGLAYLRQKDYDQAIKDHTKAVRLSPRHTRAYLSRAVAYSAKGVYHLAIADYTAALELERNAVTYKSRGDMHVKMQNYPNAIEDYTAALQLDTEYADAYIGRADAHTLMGHTKQAKADRKTAARLRGGKP
jgi:serine/threonine protein kinase